MSLYGHVKPSVVSQHPRSTSLLPFLYQTKTLLSQPLVQNCSIRASTRGTSRRDLSSSTQHRVTNSRIRRPRDNFPAEDIIFKPRDRASRSAVPFEEDVEAETEAQDTKPSTITASEKAVFERIFKDIDQSTRTEDEEDNSLEDEQDLESDPYEDLNSIFDAAIRELRLREEQAAATAARRQSRPPQQYIRAIDQVIDLQDEPPKNPPFMRPLKLPGGVVLGNESNIHEDEEIFQKATIDHRDMVANLLEQATTDVQIWDVLETQVFSLVTQLDAQVRLDKKARKNKVNEEKKTRIRQAKEKAKGAVAATSTSASKDTSLVEGNSASVDVSESSASGKRASSHVPTSVAIEKNTTFSILRSNYSHYLLSALRLLRRHHPTSFFALYLLPTMKRLGPISYVLGASTGLYNEILFLKWTQFSDLHGMADVMQEMKNQGIETNEVTMFIIRKLKQKRAHGLLGRFGPVVKAWWEMRGNKEGWARVWGIYETFRKEQRRSEKEASEAGEGDEGDREAELEEDEVDSSGDFDAKSI